MMFSKISHRLRSFIALPAPLGAFGCALAILCPFSAAPARADAVFGTNTGTFTDYFPTNAMTNVPMRSWSAAATPFAGDRSVLSPSGALIADGGTVTYAQNYP